MKNLQSHFSELKKFYFAFFMKILTIREKGKYYQTVCVINEGFFSFIIISKIIENQADQFLRPILQTYNQYLLSQYVVKSFTFAFLILCVLLFAIFLYFLAQIFRRGIQITTKCLMKDKIYTIALLCYSIIHIICLPTLILAIENISNLNYISLTSINYIQIPIISAIICFDGKSKIYQHYFVIIAIFIFLPYQILIKIIIALFSLYFGLKKSLNQSKIIYYNFAIITIFSIFLQISNMQEIPIYFFILIIFAVPIIIYIFPQQIFLTEVEQNDFLLSVFDQMISEKMIKFNRRHTAIKIIAKFADSLQEIQINEIGEKQYFQLKQFTSSIDQQNIFIDLIEIKIKTDIQRNFKLTLAIQLIACQLKKNFFNLQLLYEVQKLVTKVNKKSNFEDKIRLTEIISIIQNNYLRRQQSINTTMIIEVEKRIQKFYLYIMNIISVAIQFWTYQKKSLLFQQKINNYLSKIVQIQNQIMKLLSQIAQYRTIKIEAKVYNYILKLLNFSNCYQNEFQENKKELVFDTNYILTEQGRVLEISNQIANQIDLGPTNIKGADITKLFPTSFHPFIKNYLAGVFKQKDIEDIILPLQLNNGIFKPLRSKIQILPDLHNGVRLIIHFHDTTDLQEYPYVLYSSKVDQFISVSNDFYKYFNLKENTSMFTKLNPQTIFGFDLYNHIVNPSFRQQKIFCEFSKKAFNNPTVSKTTNKASISICMQIIQKYQMENDNLVLIELRKNQFESKKWTSETLKQFLQNKELLENNRDKYKDQKYFCRIQNPYENLIDQKLQKNKQFNLFTYKNIVILLLFLFLLIVITILVILMVRTNTISRQLSSIFEQSSTWNKQSAAIYSLFYQYYQYYHISKFPNQYLKIQNYNIPKLIKEYAKKSNSNVVALINNEMSGLLYRRSLKMNLTFINFNITTQTDTTSIIDYLQYCKLAIQTLEPSFMVKNQPSSVKIIQSLQNDDIIRNRILDLNFFQTQLYYFTICSFLILSIILNLIIVYIKISLVKILKIYQAVTANDSDQILQKLMEIQFALNRSQFFRGEINKTKKQKCLAHQESHSQLIDQKINLSNISLIKKEKSGMKTVSESAKMAKNQSTGVFLIKKNIFCLIPIFFVLFLLFYNQMLAEMKRDFILINDYAIDLQSSANQITKDSSRYFQKGMQYIVKEHTFQHNISTIKPLSTNFNKPLPQDFFVSFKILENVMLKGNLCIYAYLNNGSLYQNIICEDILYGVMKNGYAQALNQFQSVIDKYSNASLPEFGDIFRPKAVYPLFMEICYLRRTIYNIISSLQTTFNTSTQYYIHNWINKLNLSLQVSWLITPIIITISLFLLYRIHCKCKIALRYLTIIPKQLLLNLKITRTFKSNKILKHLEYLAY